MTDYHKVAQWLGPRYVVLNGASDWNARVDAALSPAEPNKET